MNNTILEIVYFSELHEVKVLSQFIGISSDYIFVFKKSVCVSSPAKSYEVSSPIYELIPSTLLQFWDCILFSISLAFRELGLLRCTFLWEKFLDQILGVQISIIKDKNIDYFPEK